MTRARNTADELSLITAKGDLLAGSASGVQSKLAVGSNNTVLTADSSTGTGLKWATPSSATNYSLLGTGTLTGAATITVSGISGMNKLWVIVETAGSSASASSRITLRLNSDSGTNYFYGGFAISMLSTFDVAGITRQASTDTQYELCTMGTSATSTWAGGVFIDGCNSSGIKMMHSSFGVTPGSGGNSQVPNIVHGWWNGSATVSSISLISTIGNFDAGTYKVYGSAA